MPVPRVIFFDAVGTLIHPDPPAPAVYADVGRRHGSRLDPAAIPARFHTAFRRQEELDFAAGLRTNEPRELARWRAIVAEVLDDVVDPEACFHELYNHFGQPEAWRCEPQTEEVLAALRARGYGLGLASNFDSRLCGLIEGLPQLNAIEHLVVSSLIGWRKPARDFFEVMCETVNLPPEHVLYVGDDPVNDYEGGRAAGLPVLLLDPHGKGSIPAEVRIGSLGEVAERYSEAAPGHDS